MGKCQRPRPGVGLFRRLRLRPVLNPLGHCELSFDGHWLAFLEMRQALLPLGRDRPSLSMIMMTFLAP